MPFRGYGGGRLLPVTSLGLAVVCACACSCASSRRDVESAQSPSASAELPPYDAGATTNAATTNAATTSPCAVVLCGGASLCVVGADGAGRCAEPDASPGGCLPSGCGGTICADAPVFSTCIFKPEHACYRKATCARDPRTGRCAWRPTPELDACLANPPRL